MSSAPERPSISSETDALLHSIRRWLSVVAFLLGVAVVALADVGYVVSDYQHGLLFAVVGVAGGAVALVAGHSVLAGLFPDAPDDASPE